MRQILESHWQTNGIGGPQNFSALPKKKMLWVGSSSCPLRRHAEMENMLQTSDSSKVGGPQAWEGLESCSMTVPQGSRMASERSQDGAQREAGRLTLDLPASVEILVPPSFTQRQQSCQPEIRNMGSSCVRLSRDKGTEYQHVSLKLELSQRSPPCNPAAGELQWY